MVGVAAENQISIVLLGIRHAVVKRLEGRREFLDAVRVSIDNLTIGSEIVDRAHVAGVSHTGLPERIHRAGVVAHDLRDRLPEGFLVSSDLKPRMKVVDAGIDRGMGRHGHDMRACLSLPWRGGTCRSGERRDGEKQSGREHRHGPALERGGRALHGFSPREFGQGSNSLRGTNAASALRANSIEQNTYATLSDRGLSDGGRLRAR